MTEWYSKVSMYLLSSIYLFRPWCWERLKAGGEGDNREWDSWRASPTRWTWVWVGSRNWWWTVKPGVLQSIGLQGIRHHWVTEMNWSIYLSMSHLPYPFIHGQTLRLFYISAIMTNATIKMNMQSSLQNNDFISFRYKWVYMQNGIAEVSGNSFFFFFFEQPPQFSWLYQFTLPLIVYRSPFTLHSPQHLLLSFQ